MGTSLKDISKLYDAVVDKINSLKRIEAILREANEYLLAKNDELQIENEKLRERAYHFYPTDFPSEGVRVIVYTAAGEVKKCEFDNDYALIMSGDCELKEVSSLMNDVRNKKITDNLTVVRTGTLFTSTSPVFPI